MSALIRRLRHSHNNLHTVLIARASEHMSCAGHDVLPLRNINTARGYTCGRWRRSFALWTDTHAIQTGWQTSRHRQTDRYADKFINMQVCIFPDVLR